MLGDFRAKVWQRKGVKCGKTADVRNRRVGAGLVRYRMPGTKALRVLLFSGVRPIGRLLKTYMSA